MILWGFQKMTKMRTEKCPSASELTHCLPWKLLLHITSEKNGSNDVSGSQLKKVFRIAGAYGITLH